MNKLSIIVLLLTLINRLECISDYKVVSVNNTDSTISIDLSYNGNQTNYGTQKNKIIKNLQFVLKCHSRQDFTFKIIDRDQKRFQIPRGYPFSTDPMENFTFPIAYSDFSFKFIYEPFDFSIIRKSSSEILFDSSYGTFIYSDYFIMISTKIASKYLYGFGQRFSRFRAYPGNFTIMGADNDDIDIGQLGLESYGHYPIYLNREQSKLWDCIHFRNSNPMTVEINDHQQSYKITYRTIGGILEFRYILGDDKYAGNTINRFLKIVGKAAIPPFWSLGYHQSRWGYKNINELKTVINKFEQFKIPLDTVWLDLDYMQNNVDFTLDTIRFPQQQLNKIAQNYHIVPITHGQLRIQDSTTYNEAYKQNIFIRSADGDLQQGRQRSGDVNFIDYFHPNSSQYWINRLKYLNTLIPFDGIWLDMNEYNNFCDGNCRASKVQTIFDYNVDIPYSVLPKSKLLQDSNLSFNATVFIGCNYPNVAGYMSLLMAQATSKYLLLQKQRPFILSRAGISGTNQYAIHWTGDTHTRFDYLKISIGGNFLGSLWGYQFMGADICGFEGNTTDQLCARWYQLGSTYTFSRNHHNSVRFANQQPYQVGPMSLKSAYNNLRLRYAFLKQYYTEFIVSNGIGMIWKPLFNDFQDQECVYDDISDTQFLLSSYLMGAPVVEQNVNSRSVYFPTLNWYDLNTGQMYQGNRSSIIQNSPSDLLPLFLREGKSMFFQNVQNITKSREFDNTFYIISGLKKQSKNLSIIYKSEGMILSIKDYNNQSNIQGCLQFGCYYSYMLSFIEQTPNIVQLKVVYNGGQNLNQQILVTNIILYGPEGKRMKTFSQPISIRKSETFILDFSSDSII